MPLVTRTALTTAVLLVLGLPLIARHAIAADTTDQDDRSDRISDQADAINAAQDGAQEPRAVEQRSPSAPCNHCGHDLSFIAIRAADDCGSLHLSGSTLVWASMR